MEAPTPTRDSERRHATVVFADLSGFTRMSERLDPEEVTDIINRCLATLAGVVTAHGGHVDKYIGDCVMALFGVPAALEKAPQQAINAAIEMRNQLARLVEERSIGVPLKLHIGINTGLVIAGHVGGEARQEFTVFGDAVNVASRLKDVAPNGSIYVGAETHRYTREEFEFRKLQPLAVKGKERPLEAYELLSLKERIHRSKPAGTDRMIVSPLVGRDHELQLLRACLMAAACGEGGIVNLIGEAGLGKSRLLAEACASEEGKEVAVLEGRSLSVGKGLRFHPFIDLLKQWAGIADEDAEPEARDKLETAIGGLAAEESEEIFPFVATLMGARLTGAHAERVAGIEGEAMEKLIVKSMRELLRRLALVRPLVLIFEDLHWADLSSIQLLESLLRLVPESAILFVHAFRPDHPETSERILRVSREQHGRQQMEIHLDALDDRHCHALVCNLFKTDQLPYSTLAHITRTGEGNPFYLEEVVRSLIDGGVVEQVKGQLVVTDRIQSVVIPDTIQGVVMARVDRLPPSTRQLLQVASVVGRSFHHRILAQIAPPDIDLRRELERLKERQLLLERKTRRTASPRRRNLGEEAEYVFTHALVQETVYGSILQKTRRELHLRVAETIEAVFAERLQDFYGMLAYHFSRAENLPKAEEYLFKAGAEAARAAASSEALAFFREASTLYLAMHGTGGDPKKKALLEENIALALVNKGELTESIDHFDRALEHLGERVPRTPPALALLFLRNIVPVLYRVYVRPAAKGRIKDLDRERAIFELFRSRGRAETTSDPRRLFLEIPWLFRRLSRVDPRQIERACGMYVSCGAIFAYSGISFALSERMLRIARTLIREGNFMDLFIYREAEFVYHYLLGNWADEYLIENELVEQNLRYGQVWDVSNYLGLECDRRLRHGDFAGARRILARLADINDAYGYAFAGVTRDGMLAILLLEERNLAKALSEAESYCAARHEDALKVFALGLIAKAAVLLGDRARAAPALVRAEDIVKRSPVIPTWHRSSYLVARLLFDLTALEEAAERGDREQWRTLRRQARRAARQAVRIVAKVAKERTETYRLVGRLSWVLGNRRRALAWWAKSIAEGERLRARPELARTYLEVGQRLAGRGRLAGLDGAECLRKALRLLSEMGLAWDLERLGAGEPASPMIGETLLA